MTSRGIIMERQPYINHGLKVNLLVHSDSTVQHYRKTANGQTDNALMSMASCARNNLGGNYIIKCLAYCMSLCLWLYV